MTKNTDNSPYIPFKEYPKAPDLEMSLRIILGQGIFERKSFKNFMKHTTNRDIALEVGGHVGSWTLGMSKLFNHVITFEPQDTNRKFLERNIKKSDTNNITVIPFAVANDLKQSFNISSNGSTRNSGQAHLIPTSNNDAQQIQTVRLDDALASYIKPNQSIGALKIDVEGFELEVLKSGVETIKKHKPTILLEINQLGNRYGVQSHEIYDLMDNLNYSEIAHHRHDHIFKPNL